MKRSALVTLPALLVLLAGCAPAGDGERDETAFLEHMRSTGGVVQDRESDAELLEAGDALCAAAGDKGDLSDAFQTAIEMSPDASIDVMSYWGDVSIAAESLCPNRA